MRASTLVLLLAFSITMLAPDASAQQTAGDAAGQRSYPASKTAGFGTAEELPSDGSIAMRAARKRFCRSGSQVDTPFSHLGIAVFCRECADYELRRVCTDPSRPSTCRSEWVQVSDTDHDCEAVRDWVLQSMR